MTEDQIEQAAPLSGGFVVFGSATSAEHPTTLTA
jgi:hypothetical protein